MSSVMSTFFTSITTSSVLDFLSSDFRERGNGTGLTDGPLDGPLDRIPEEVDIMFMLDTTSMPALNMITIQMIECSTGTLLANNYWDMTSGTLVVGIFYY